MNTETVAGKIYEVVNGLRIFEEVTLKNMYDVIDPSELEQYDSFIIGTSTWGDGSYPPDAEEFMDRVMVTPPKLEGKTAIFFGLGESHYEFYCTSTERMRDYFIDELKVKVDHELKKIDGYPDDSILNEVEEWIKKIYL
jgi:flavodoxin